MEILSDYKNVFCKYCNRNVTSISMTPELADKVLELHTKVHLTEEIRSNSVLLSAWNEICELEQKIKDNIEIRDTFDFNIIEKSEEG